MVQGRIYRGSEVAFAFFPLALLGWGGVGVGVVVGFCGPGGGRDSTTMGFMGFKMT